MPTVAPALTSIDTDDDTVNWFKNNVGIHGARRYICAAYSHETQCSIDPDVPFCVQLRSPGKYASRARRVAVWQSGPAVHPDILFLTLDSCRYDSFVAARAPLDDIPAD